MAVCYTNLYTPHSAWQAFNEYLVFDEGRVQFRSKVRLLLSYDKLLLKEGTKEPALEKYQLSSGTLSLGTGQSLPSDREQIPE